MNDYKDRGMIKWQPFDSLTNSNEKNIKLPAITNKPVTKSNEINGKINNNEYYTLEPNSNNNNKKDKFNNNNEEESIYNINSKNKVNNINNEINEIKSKVNELQNDDDSIKKEIENKIAQGPNASYYRILMGRYVHNKTFKQIAIENNYSRKQVYRLHDKALDCFEEMFEGSYKDYGIKDTKMSSNDPK